MPAFDYDSWKAKMATLEIGSTIGKAILERLSKQGLTATQLSNELSVPLPTVLYHLTRLEMIGVVSTQTKLGKRLREMKCYRLAADKVVLSIKGTACEPQKKNENGGET